MKCIYCNSVIKEGEVYCPKCGKEAQLVPDYNILDDEFLKELMEERASKQAKTPPQKESSSPKKEKKPVQTSAPKKKARNEDTRVLAQVTITVLAFVFVVIVVGSLLIIRNNRNHSFEYQMTQGQQAMEKGRYEKAAGYFEQALKLEKKNVDAYLSLGNAYFSMENYEDSMTTYKEAIELEPNNAEAYRGLLTVYDAQGKYDRISEIGEDIEDNELREQLSEFLVSTPVFSKESGTYTSGMELRIDADGDTVVYYTTNGKNPITHGETYEDPFDLTEDGTYSFRAVSVNSKGVYSRIAEANYVIDLAAPEMPEVYPDGGKFYSETYITISVPDGCTAYYTWDDTVPDTSSEKYTEPLLVELGSNVLSVIIVDDTTDKVSQVYRRLFSYFEG